MFQTSQKTSGIDYTATIALAALGIVFSPAVILMSGHFDGGRVTMALIFSAACLLLSWVSWHYYSRRSIPTLENPASGSK
jgi:hypothetical protein